MACVKLTAKDRKNMKPMSQNDIMTDEQKAKLEAERFEEYAKHAYDKIVKRIASYRAELAADLEKTAKIAAQPDGDPLWQMDRSTPFEVAAKIRVYSRIVANKPEGATYTEWINEAKRQAVEYVLRETTGSQSTSMLANYVTALEVYTYKQFAQGWFY